MLGVSAAAFTLATMVGWMQAAPALSSTSSPPVAALAPGQLLHPLQIDLDVEAEAPGARAEDGWTLVAVSLELDGARIVDQQPVVVAGPSAAGAPGQPVSLWKGDLPPGPHTLLALLLYRRQPAGGPVAEIEVEQPRQFRITPGRPLALQLTPRSPPAVLSERAAASSRLAAAPRSPSSRFDRQ